MTRMHGASIEHQTVDMLIETVAAIIVHSRENNNEFKTSMWMNFETANKRTCVQPVDIISELIMETKHSLEEILQILVYMFPIPQYAGDADWITVHNWGLRDQLQPATD